MSSHALKVLAHAAVTVSSTGNTTLITCPSGHVYTIYFAALYLDEGSSNTIKGYFELSDTAGANFHRVSNIFETDNLGGASTFQAAGQDALNDPTAADEPPTEATISMYGLSMEYGQVLRFNCSNAGAGGPTGSVVVTGIDSTL